MQSMKRITQLVALVVALVFAGQSALAEAPCPQWLLSGDDHALGCCIAAPGAAGHQLAAGCHGSMQSEPIASECNQSGCHMATAQAVAQAVTAPKSRAGRAASFAAIAQLPVIRTSVHPTRFFESAPAPGPARYLLFQVFRI